MGAGLFRRVVRVCAVAIGAASLAACAQPKDKAAVGIGTAAYVLNQPAKPYAILYKPYAQMATVAYTDPPYLSGNACPSVQRLRASKTDDNVAYAKMVEELERDEWSCRFGHVGPYGCKQGTPRCLDGLEYHVWKNCRLGVAVIAFRGSDANEIGDWLSNFRWFLGKRYFDQYDQVEIAVPDIIDALYHQGCRPRVIIAVGHSLGGGLAQHGAYADNRISYVYAFDPSPVTGFFGIPFPTRSRATENLGIDRVYEAGEILSLPRYLASGLFPSSQCRPRVRIVRFATVTEPSIIERHRIRNLTKGLADLSGHATQTEKGRLGFAHARACDYVQPDKFGE
jgi:pimeloyl-ACP methyl ester carboxylesterase